MSSSLKTSPRVAIVSKVTDQIIAIGGLIPLADISATVALSRKMVLAVVPDCPNLEKAFERMGLTGKAVQQ